MTGIERRRAKGERRVERIPNSQTTEGRAASRSHVFIPERRCRLDTAKLHPSHAYLSSRPHSPGRLSVSLWPTSCPIQLARGHIFALYRIILTFMNILQWPQIGLRLVCTMVRKLVRSTKARSITVCRSQISAVH